MNNLDSPKDHWKGENIIIESQSHFDNLIKQGYEVTEHVVELQEGKTQLTLLMKSDKNALIANANSIFDYVAKCLYLYDYKKKKISFTWVQDTDIFWKFGKTIVDILDGSFVNPILVKPFNIFNKKIGYESIREWIKSEKRLKNSLGNLSILSNVFFLNEKNHNISIDIISKNKLSLTDVHEIITKTKSYDSSIAISYFILTKNISKINDEKDDLLIGIIVYDVKNDEVLSFNIRSMSSFYNKTEYKKPEILFNVIEDLFIKSFDEKLDCKSSILVPINSRWYTPIPWLQYSVLTPTKLDENLITNSSKDISIQLFFTFGMFPDFQKRGNITYNPFSNQEKGRFSCVLYFYDSENQIPYNLRFDQSKGEKLVHLDFAFGNATGENKIIAHRTIDFKDIFEFNQEFFLHVIMAGLFDSYFTTVIQNGLKGIKELYEQNPAIFSVLNTFWRVENAIDWLNKNKRGYEILDKLHKEKQLSKKELQLVNDMIKSELGIITPATNDEPVGINTYGFVVLFRYKKGMTTTSLTKSNN